MKTFADLGFCRMTNSWSLNSSLMISGSSHNSDAKWIRSGLAPRRRPKMTHLLIPGVRIIVAAASTFSGVVPGGFIKSKSTLASSISLSIKTAWWLDRIKEDEGCYRLLERGRKSTGLARLILRIRVTRKERQNGQIMVQESSLMQRWCVGCLEKVSVVLHDHRKVHPEAGGGVLDPPLDPANVRMTLVW